MLEKKVIPLPGKEDSKHATIYSDSSAPTKSVIIYLHGGALIYGSRDDLPKAHLEAFCHSGHPIIAIDYPLCPEATLLEIIEDVASSIEWYISNRVKLFGDEQKYVLFGRSAGAYLALLMLRQNLSEAPSAIISYYGYGVFVNGWYCTPSSFYIKYPLMPETCLRKKSGRSNYSLPIQLGYSTYVYLRQRGEWGKYLGAYNESISTLTGYAARNAPPVFLAHSVGDTDVPYDEYLALQALFPKAKKFTSYLSMHDFDSDECSKDTQELLKETILFLNDC